MTRRHLAAEHGFTLIELRIVITIILILVAIPVASYLGYRDRANDATARANVHVLLPSVEAYHSDNDTYAGMTPAALKTSYDSALDPTRYTFTSLSQTSYCVASSSGGRSWKKIGPGGVVTPGSCP